MVVVVVLVMVVMAEHRIRFEYPPRRRWEVVEMVAGANITDDVHVVQLRLLL